MDESQYFSRLHKKYQAIARPHPPDKRMIQEPESWTDYYMSNVRDGVDYNLLRDGLNFGSVNFRDGR